jgi:hypothetical protein
MYVSPDAPPTPGPRAGIQRAWSPLPRAADRTRRLGDHGWLQRVNLAVSGVMVLVAAYGILRAMRNGRGLSMAALTGLYGRMFDPELRISARSDGRFPAGSAGGTVSTSGALHMLFGAIGFVALAAAAFSYARWTAGRGESGRGKLGAACGAVILVSFLAAAALGPSAAGVGLMWLAVLGGWVWLATAAAHLYTVVPHPVLSLRTGGAA